MREVTNEFEFIRKKVIDALKSRGILNNKNIDEYTQSCFDVYMLCLEKGLSKKDSLDISILSLNKILVSYCETNNLISFNKYSSLLCTITFIFCIIVSLIGWFVADVLSVYRVIYPIYLIITLGFLFFAICTYKKRNKLDFIIIALIFLSAVAINIQCFIYFYRARTGNFYYSLNYQFFGILKFNTHMITSLEPLNYKISNTITLFDPTLIISFVCLIFSIAFDIIERRKKYVRNIA